MNGRERSFVSRGVLLFIFGVTALASLSSIDARWAHHVRNVGTIILFIGIAVFIIFVVARQTRQFSTAPTSDKPLPASVYSPLLRRTARMAIAASSLAFVILVAVVLVVEPPQQCPNWHLPDQRSTSMLVPILWSSLVLSGLIFIGVRWCWFIRRAIESVDSPTMMPVPYVLMMAVLMGCGMSQLPLVLLATRCWLKR